MCNEKIFIAKTPDEYQKDFDEIMKEQEEFYSTGIPSNFFGNIFRLDNPNIFNCLKGHHDIIRGKIFKQKLGE